jgi:signal-transduction protein with cAMP-binding, CBS, and nucleotidyltransferase domain
MKISEVELQAHRIFSELDDADLQAVIEQATVGHFSTGEYLIQEGVENPSLYLIRSGTVSVRSYGVEFARLRSGSMAGEISAAGISLPIADVIALDKVTAFMIPAGLIRTLASRHQSFRDGIHDTAMRRVLG